MLAHEFTAWTVLWNRPGTGPDTSDSTPMRISVPVTPLSVAPPLPPLGAAGVVPAVEPPPPGEVAPDVPPPAPPGAPPPAPPGGPWGSGAFHLRRAAVAGAPAGRGVGPGSVVGLRLPAGPEYVVAYLAAAKVGAVTAGLNPRLTDAEQAKLLDVAGPALVLDDPAAVHELHIPDVAPPASPDDPALPVAIGFTPG